MSVDIFADQPADRVAIRRGQTIGPKAQRGWTWIIVVALVFCFFADRNQKPQPPNPIDEKGFRVLVVEETESRRDLSEGQLQALLSLKVRRWLDDNCADVDGEPARRFIDCDTDLADAGATWQEMKRHAHEPFPCVVISHPPNLSVHAISRDFDADRLLGLLQQAKGDAS